MAKFLELLKNKNFLFLWLGQVISQFGDRLNQMALIALISLRAPNSALQLAKVLSFTIIPVFLVGPIACSYVDRWDRRRTMIFCDLISAALVASIVLFLMKLEAIWPIYLGIFLVFSVRRFFVPAKMSIIPELVPTQNLLLANSLTATTGMIGAVAGFGLGGLIVERAGFSGGFLIDALTYLVSGLFILMITTKTISYLRKEQCPKEQTDLKKLMHRTIFADIKEGWQHLVKDRQTRFIARLFFLLGSTIGAVSVVIIVFVQKTLGSVTLDLGILAMFLGLGLFIGSLIYGRFGQRVSRMKMIFVSLGASGITLTIFALFLQMFASILVASILSLVLGLTISPTIISAHTLVHELTAEKMRGRIFGLLEVIGYLAFFLFMFLGSFLADKIGRFWILLFVGLILTAVGLGTIIRKVDRTGATDAGI